MPFYCGKRSAGTCVVLGPKKFSTYSSEYACDFFEPAASHLPASSLPRNEGLLGQTPRLLDGIHAMPPCEQSADDRLRKRFGSVSQTRGVDSHSCPFLSISTLVYHGVASS